MSMRRSLNLHSYKEEDEYEKKKVKKEDIKIIAQLKGLMKVIIKDRFFLLDPKRYDLNNLMMYIDLKKINKIEEKFELFPSGLDRLTFIKLLKDEIGYNSIDPYDELNLIYGLYKLFCEIDLSGDGIMQWSEFTQFMIDSVEGEEDANDPNDEKGQKEKEMIKYKRYMISDKVKDYNIHKQDIISAVYYTKIDKVFVTEYNSKILKIYNPKSGKCDCNFDLENFFQDKIKEVELDKKKFSKKQKFNVENKKSLTFSALHLSLGPKNILAVCMSNNKIAFFNFRSNLSCDLLYQMNTTVLQKKIWYLKNHDIWVSSGRKQENDKYYYLYELDIDFEVMENHVDCLYNEGHWYRTIFFENPADPFSSTYGLGHTGEILDVVEIHKPQLILTACIDGKIRVFNINDKEFIKVWNTHDGGVKTLSYNPNIDLNGLIISTGFQYHINLFMTDLSLDDAYKGKLEGHAAPVVSARFLAQSYMCVSVDEEASVKIWDTNQRICLQTIANVSRNITINNLVYIEKYNRFAIYGNKMIFYDQKYNEDEMTKVSEEEVDINYPLQCEFNLYHMNFFVATLKDLRVYSSRNGNLIYVFKKFLTQERFDVGTKIKCFKFDYRQRLIYLGFTNGTIQQFNAGNGSLIKPIDEYEIEKDGVTTVKTYHTKEVNDMFLFWNNPEEEDFDFVLVTTGSDSLINMFNEKQPEESSMLRSIKGSHKIGEKNNEILCMDFSRRYNIFATGSVDGIVNIWDFEKTKFEECCFINDYRPNGSFNVIALKFIDPYPVLAVAYSNGALFLWGTPPDTDLKGECFFRTMNLYKKETVFEPKQISSLAVIIMDNELKIDKEDGKINLEDGTYLKEYPPEIEIDEDLQNNEIYQISNYVKDVNDPLIEELKEYGGRFPYLICGDSKGYVKIINLYPIFQKYKVKVLDRARIQSSYNILKTGETRADTTLMQFLAKKKSFLNPWTSLYPNLICFEYKCHYDDIINISRIEVPPTIITVSKDKRVRIWDENFNLIGETFTGMKAPNPELCPWKFKLDWQKLKKAEILEFYGIMKDLNIDMGFMKRLTKDDNTKENILIEEDKKERVDSIFKTQISKKKKRFKKLENKEKKTNIENDNIFNETYEGRFIQEMDKNIELQFNKQPEEIGMNEMSRNVIDSIILGKDINELFNPTMKKPQKLGSFKLPNINVNNRIMKENKENKEENKPKLFSEKFMKNSQSSKNYKQTLILPLLKHNFKLNPNIKFRQGETEKILAFEYYQNSYNHCVKVNKSQEPIESLKANYKMMWDYVEGYKKKSKRFKIKGNRYG